MPKGIQGIDHALRMACDESLALDGWQDTAGCGLVATLKDAANDGLLPPAFTGLEFSFGSQTRKFRTGPRTAR